VKRHLPIALLLVAMGGCFEDIDGGVLRFVQTFEVPEARPGFTSGWTVELYNESGSTYEVTALSIEADDDGSPPGMFAVELDDPDRSFPVLLEPQRGLAVRVSFSPNTLGERTASLQAVTFLTDVRIGGGGCSGGRGRAAPDAGMQVVWGDVLAVATADASFEDCGDGVDNDADGAVDCEDRDCGRSADCVPTEGCTPTGDLQCGGAISSSTDGREDTFDEYCDIESEAFPSGEEVWSYLPVETGTTIVRLQADGWDPTLVLLEGEFSQDGVLQCDPTSCVARGNNPGPTEAIEFVAEAGRGYFFVVDGDDGEEGPYSLSVGCGLDEEANCTDGLDDDGDGLVDCDDPDCLVDPACAPSGTCEPGATLGCGDSITGINAGGGTTRAVDRWCAEGSDHTGAEVAWMFVADTNTRATVRLSEMTRDLDLIAMLENPAGGGTCDPSLCIFDEDWVRGDGDEVVSFDAFQGTPYVLAVDGWEGAASSFRLEISCE